MDKSLKQSPELFCKKRSSEKFRKIHRKILVLEPLFNKVARLQACSFIKKRLQHRCFHVDFAKFLRTTILNSICERMRIHNPVAHIRGSFLQKQFTAESR